jgi:hypothetical protein
LQARSGRMKSTFMHDGLSTLGRSRCRARQLSLALDVAEFNAARLSCLQHYTCIFESPSQKRIGNDEDDNNVVAKLYHVVVYVGKTSLVSIEAANKSKKKRKPQERRQPIDLFLSLSACIYPGHTHVPAHPLVILCARRRLQEVGDICIWPSITASPRAPLTRYGSCRSVGPHVSSGR